MSRSIGVIVARMGSSRLHGKAAKELGGRPVLEHVIRALKRSRFLDEVVLATTRNPEDRILVDIASCCGIAVRRGCEIDVLGRVVDALADFPSEGVLVAYGDNPLISEEIVDLLVAFRDREALDQAFMPGLPVGADVLAFSRRALEISAEEARLDIEREHLNAFLSARPERFRIGRLAPPQLLEAPQLRLTVDTETDLDMLREIECELDRRGAPFELGAVTELAREMPEMMLANALVEQRYATESWRRQRRGDKVL